MADRFILQNMDFVLTAPNETIGGVEALELSCAEGVGKQSMLLHNMQDNKNIQSKKIIVAVHPILQILDFPYSSERNHRF